jgi:anti-sigma factor ChrR (cupin superfamily)
MGWGARTERTSQGDETMPEITRDTNQMEWKQTNAYPDGTMIKVLREEGEARSVLLKLPPGFRIDAHVHTDTEQHFVLEGEYESQGVEHGPGTYQCIPAHASHGPFSSRAGAVILIIWDA